ncbi:helix-turn-helix domain-containing protein [Polyangium jinanense]|uniref:Helix-turn-helix transcriptional regulator n=1 Tax=Polyangium jinanense TaxID=2829994 RepID=A0A9X3XBW5_9BACT|nr:helix-turn-helix domain-containing protein [Polyangium jinanense]MDC3985923.1 helix-turn-helix transcriptional regulator [Polyangium jinanense]
MTDDYQNGATIPIRERIQTRLDELEQTPAWLAEKVGVSRSTITRILKGERNPTPETLHEIAPVLGEEVAQLVAGTDAEKRVKEAQDIVSRRDYEAAVRQVVDFERKANDLAAQVRELNERCAQEQIRARKLTDQLEESERKCGLIEEERDRARREALHHEQDARRYCEGLEKAVADVVALRAQVRELGAAVESGRTTSRVAAILAGVAAAVSVASYLGGDSDDGKATGKDSQASEVGTKRRARGRG